MKNLLVVGAVLVLALTGYAAHNKEQHVYNEVGILSARTLSPSVTDGDTSCYDSDSSVGCSDDPAAGILVTLTPKNDPKHPYVISVVHPLDSRVYKGQLYVTWLSKHEPLLDDLSNTGKPVEVHYRYQTGAILELGDVKEPNQNVVCVPWIKTDKNGNVKKQAEVCYVVM